jgi:hypothetical protein
VLAEAHKIRVKLSTKVAETQTFADILASNVCVTATFVDNLARILWISEQVFCARLGSWFFTCYRRQGAQLITEIANSIRSQGTLVDDKMLFDCYLETLQPKYELIVKFFLNNDKPFDHFLQE